MQLRDDEHEGIVFMLLILLFIGFGSLFLLHYFAPSTRNDGPASGILKMCPSDKEAC